MHAFRCDPRYFMRKTGTDLITEQNACCVEEIVYVLNQLKRKGTTHGTRALKPLSVLRNSLFVGFLINWGEDYDLFLWRVNHGESKRGTKPQKQWAAFIASSHSDEEGYWPKTAMHTNLSSWHLQSIFTASTWHALFVRIWERNNLWFLFPWQTFII